MKQILAYVLIIALLVLVSCSKVSSDAVELKVDFTWEGFAPCGVGSLPEIRVSGIPSELLKRVYPKDNAILLFP